MAINPANAIAWHGACQSCTEIGESVLAHVRLRRAGFPSFAREQVPVVRSVMVKQGNATDTNPRKWKIGP
ncbi:MAG: hypothetical protein CL489_01940 [Acidobacteria bacterium]|nr:hypothetical protein [Acidobacteriota bacterium]